MTRARDASALVGQCALVTEDTHECDSQQGFSGNEESSTHSTSDVLSCVPQTPSLSAAPQPFGYSCWNSDRNPKPKVV